MSSLPSGTSNCWLKEQQREEQEEEHEGKPKVQQEVRLLEQQRDLLQEELKEQQMFRLL